MIKSDLVCDVVGFHDDLALLGGARLGVETSNVLKAYSDKIQFGF